MAEEAGESGLYETLQFPFSYLAGERDLNLVKLCEEHNVGFICMKGLAGGLINNSRAAMAFMTQHPWALPIWGIQRMSELEEWLSFMDETPVYDDEIAAFVESERAELMGEFCRGCGYCMPCPVGIQINNCARMSLMLRRAPSAKLAERALAGRDGQDPELPALQPVPSQVPLRARHARPPGEELRGLPARACRRGECGSRQEMRGLTREGHGRGQAA